jgi:hypothetical protein
MTLEHGHEWGQSKKSRHKLPTKYAELVLLEVQEYG